MHERIILKRVFELRGADGRNVDAVAKLAALGVQVPTFSLTSQHGAAHEEIIAAAPDDVRADLKTLALVHLCGVDGTPMHAVANAAYHLSESRFDAAASALGGVVQAEELYVLFGETSRRAADPALVEQYLKKPIAEAKRMVRTRRQMQEGSRSFIGQRKEMQDLNQSITTALLRRKPLEADELERVAEGLIDEGTKERVARVLKAKAFDVAMAEFAREHCSRIWAERAEAAKGALSKPDYRVAGRPTAIEDPTTYTGFARKWGLELIVSDRRPEGTVPGKLKWTCKVVGKVWRGSDNDLEKKLNCLVLDGYTQPGEEEPTIEDVLECLRSDMACVTDRTQDEFIEELGYGENLASVRKGEEIYAALKDYVLLFKRITGGEEAYQELLTRVGDDPPLSPDYFDEAVSAPAP